MSNKAPEPPVKADDQVKAELNQDELLAEISRLSTENSNLKGQIAFYSVPNLPVEVVMDERFDPPTATNRTLGHIHDSDLWAYQESIGFNEDAGYAYDPLCHRAFAILQRAFKPAMLGTIERGGHIDFTYLPKFSPEQKLNVLVWVSEN